MKVTSPALRYHGAKFRLAQWVLQFFPPHRIYTEAFGGAAGVLLQKPRSHAEIYNDLDDDVVNFFRVLRSLDTRRQLVEAVVATPYARAEFDLAWEPADDPIERARRIAVRAMMGFGSAGATKGTTGFRIDSRRKYGTAQQIWAEYPDAIAAAGQRLSGVMIENRPAVQVLLDHDDPTTLHYVDPPYVHGTRVMKNRGYRHEMTDDEHRQLLEVVTGLQGMVVLSGYESDLYSEALRGWPNYRTKARIAGGRGTAMRTEVVWINPACLAGLQRTGGLFAEAA